MKKLLMMVAVAMMMTMSVKAQSAGEWSFKGRIGSNHLCIYFNFFYNSFL